MSPSSHGAAVHPLHLNPAPHPRGRSVDEYAAPLFLAWQLTNRCSARCLACCEESGPDKAWRDELTASEALALADAIAASGIPYVAFGGGEPLGVAHAWDIFERLRATASRSSSRPTAAASTPRRRPPRRARRRLRADLGRRRTAATHERVRPGRATPPRSAPSSGSSRAGLRPQLVFVPTRLNAHEIVAAFDLAVALDCSAFVTGR
jgi:hypothetical protein